MNIELGKPTLEYLRIRTSPVRTETECFSTEEGAETPGLQIFFSPAVASVDFVCLATLGASTSSKAMFPLCQEEMENSVKPEINGNLKVQCLVDTWMNQNFPVRLKQLLPGHQRSVRSWLS